MTSEEVAKMVLTQDIGMLTKQYVKLRDKIKAADDEHKAKTKPARELLERMNGALLTHLNAIGGEAVKSENGTVYRTIKRTASIADGEKFRQYVIDNAKFDLVDWKANANAVADFIEANTVAPPGVNYAVHYEVGVRRAPGT